MKKISLSTDNCYFFDEAGPLGYFRIANIQGTRYDYNFLGNFLPENDLWRSLNSHKLMFFYETGEDFTG